MVGFGAPGFWWRPRITLAAHLLLPFSLVYGFLSSRRMERAPAFTSPLPVICVGNFVAGGTGKTPMALLLASMLRETGEAPVFLTRGYGGTLGRDEPVIVEVPLHGAHEVGDEALLLAAEAPTIVSADRAAGARLAGTLGSVIVMDDGFQNPTLAKSLSLVLADTATGVGNGCVIPAGPLRAPLEVQLPRADAVVLVGREAAAGDALRARARVSHRQVLSARLAPVPGHGLSGRRVLAFAGIGRPEKFFETLEREGARIVERHVFGDHRAYSVADAARLMARAEARDLVPVTTEKDFVRMAHGATREDPAVAGLLARCQVLKVRMVADDAPALAALLDARLGRVRGQA
ncbi:MAG: tetraacyldisaccharide 4'-kinase [Stappia sp.]|uniref:tetraacyldisaccharide 4'-kinase n=1 Tax=Stappia sp. TaxID=1870903 RepID=UPI000C413C95|nr:tetraacyldisaccharide 4'-kinase [Stappia sp.]MAA96861.1 tetraacyldisaccharide 4'-kinase [Stappia sp.]MBM21169.1 tetraacyldisaccharide 4'-kinase [Stappia sp.]